MDQRVSGKLGPNDKENNDHEKILTSQEKFYVISKCKFLHEYLQTSQKWMLKGAMNEKNHSGNKMVSRL